jgi:hypothetical protein
MIGLLQLGTGIGRGICLPIVSRGLFEACVVVPVRDPDLRATPGELRREKPGVDPTYGERSAVGWLLGCRRYRPLLAKRWVCERCPLADDGCGWLCAPLPVPSTDATLRGDEAGATEPGTGVVPELPETLTVGADDPLESVESLAEDAEGGLPAADSGGLPEGAGGLPVGGAGGPLVGGTLTVEVPGSDTLISGVPDEDVSGKETPIEGAPDGEAPSRDTLTKGALGTDPSGSDTPITEACSNDMPTTEVCSSGTPTNDVPGEDAVEELEESGACA